MKRQTHNQTAIKPRTRAYVVFTAGINTHTVQKLIETLASLGEEGVGEVYLAYSKDGGNIRAGIDLYNFLREAPFDLITHNIGSVESMGVPAFLAAKTRFASPTSRFVFHSFHWTTQARPYKRPELMEMINEIDFGQNFSESILTEKTKVGSDQAKRFHQDGIAVTPAKAVELELVHKIKALAIPKRARIIVLSF